MQPALAGIIIIALIILVLLLLLLFRQYVKNQTLRKYKIFHIELLI